MGEFPLVSLLIPCYNHEEFLDDNLASLIAQDYANIELLICDDCSPDGSYAKICAWEERLRVRFARVEILRNPVNCGVTKNVNRMLKMARGEIIKILASDDAMAPEAVSTAVAHMAQADVLILNGRKVAQDRHYPEFGPGEGVYAQAPDLNSATLFCRTALNNEIFAPGAFVRRQIYETYGTYDENIGVEDFEFWLRLSQSGTVRFSYLDRQLIYYRINANSITSQFGNTGLENRRRRFHGAQMDTLKKYAPALPAQVYAAAVLRRILDERWIAVNAGLWAWDRELRSQWQAFPMKKAVPLKQRLIWFLRCRKLDMRSWGKEKGTAGFPI